MVAKKPKRIRKGQGKWCSTTRCVMCNKLSLVNRIPDSGMIVDPDNPDMQKECPFLCDKGWFNSRGSLTI